MPKMTRQPSPWGHGGHISGRCAVSLWVTHGQDASWDWVFKALSSGALVSSKRSTKGFKRLSTRPTGRSTSGSSTGTSLSPKPLNAMAQMAIDMDKKKGFGNPPSTEPVKSTEVVDSNPYAPFPQRSGSIG